MVLLGDEAQGMLDSVHLQIVLILTEIGARFAPNVPQVQKSIWTHPMVLQGDEAQVEARSRPFKDIAELDAR
jgi:hypothetical protein